MRLKEELKNIYKTCFPEETEEYREYFFKHIYRRKNAFYAPEEKPASALHLRSRRLYIAGREFCAPFIVAVGTLPEFRSRGLMGGVIKTALNSLRRAAFVSLSTYDKHSYYEKYGFVTYSFLAEATLRGTEKYRAEEIFAPSARVAEMLTALYKQYTAEKNGYTVRDTRFFLSWQRELFADSGRLYLVYLKDEVVGYIYRDGDKYPEFVFAEGNTSSAPREFEGAKINLPAPRGTPQNMIRLINPVTALGKIAYNPAASDTVNIKITDGIIEKNNITLRLAVENGRGRVTKADSADVTVDISELAALMTGQGGAERLKKLFNKQENVVLDRY